MQTTTELVDFLDGVLVGVLRHRTAAGEYYRHLADEYGCNYQWLLNFARRHEIRSRNCHWPQADRDRAIAAVEIEDMAIREAARVTGISRSALHRMVKGKRDQIAKSPDKIGFVDVEPYRCPDHGRVTVRPCPACVALMARKKSRQM